MSVGFALAVVEGLRYNGVPVSFEPGWQTRGNGYVFPGGKPEGLIIHHTGAPYDGGLSILVGGRRDLPPPLCNSGGYADGRVHIIAAHVANHAGASGGRSMGPLPVTRLFNPRVWGHEVMYPGSAPMTVAQYRSARVLGGVISGTLGRPTPEWVRSHFETSRTGKWDIGAGEGPGVPFDMNRFRAEIWSALQGDDDMSAEAEKLIREIHREVTQRLPARSAYAKPPWSDTLLGTTLNAEGRAHEAITELRALVAGLPRMIRDEVRAVLAEQGKP